MNKPSRSFDGAADSRPAKAHGDRSALGTADAGTTLRLNRLVRIAAAEFATTPAAVRSDHRGRRAGDSMPPDVLARHAVLHLVRKHELCLHAMALRALGLASGSITIDGPRGLGAFRDLLATDTSLAAKVAEIELKGFPMAKVSSGAADSRPAKALDDRSADTSN